MVLARVLCTGRQAGTLGLLPLLLLALLVSPAAAEGEQENAAREGASESSSQAFTLVNAHPGLQAGCPLQCKVAGLHAVEAGAGTSDRFVCAHTRPNELYYGTWAESRCAVNRGGDGSPSTEAYACACVASPDDLFWAADPACASEEGAAASSPGVCRVRMPGVKKPTHVVGWLTQDGGQYTCHLPNLPWGPGGSIINSVTGLGGEFNTELLCARTVPSHASAAAAGTVHASEGVHIKETPILPPGGMFVIGGCLALIAYALFILNRDSMLPKLPAWSPLSHSE